VSIQKRNLPPLAKTQTVSIQKRNLPPLARTQSVSIQKRNLPHLANTQCQYRRGICHPWQGHNQCQYRRGICHPWQIHKQCQYKRGICHPWQIHKQFQYRRGICHSWQFWKITRYFKIPTPSVLPVLPWDANLPNPSQSQDTGLTVRAISPPHPKHGIKHSLLNCNTSCREILPQYSLSNPTPKIHQLLRSSTQDFIPETTRGPRRRRNHIHNAMPPLPKGTYLFNSAL